MNPRSTRVYDFPSAAFASDSTSGAYGETVDGFRATDSFPMPSDA